MCVHGQPRGAVSSLPPCKLPLHSSATGAASPDNCDCTEIYLGGLLTSVGGRADGGSWWLPRPLGAPLQFPTGAPGACGGTAEGSALPSPWQTPPRPAGPLRALLAPIAPNPPLTCDLQADLPSERADGVLLLDLGYHRERGGAARLLHCRRCRGRQRSRGRVSPGPHPRGLPLHGGGGKGGGGDGCRTPGLIPAASSPDWGSGSPGGGGGAGGRLRWPSLAPPPVSSTLPLAAAAPALGHLSLLIRPAPLARLSLGQSSVTSQSQTLGLRDVTARYLGTCVTFQSVWIRHRRGSSGIKILKRFLFFGGGRGGGGLLAFLSTTSSPRRKKKITVMFSTVHHRKILNWHPENGKRNVDQRVLDRAPRWRRSLQSFQAPWNPKPLLLSWNHVHL